MKVVIVGGVAGGASTAARLRRLDENAQIIMLERGDYISFANCALPYFIGDVIQDKNELTLQTPESFRARFNVEVRVRSEVTAVHAEKKTVTVKNLETGESYEESYDKLVLSPGAKLILPPMEGAQLEEVFTIRNIPDTYQVKSYLLEHHPKRAVVVGGGYIGMEMAENLHRAGLEVTIVELADHLIGPLDWDMAQEVLRHVTAKGLKVLLGTGVQSIRKAGEGLTVGLTSKEELAADLVILSVGVLPDTAFLKDSGLEFGLKGAIKVDEQMRTSLPDVYAVGDAVQVRDFVTGEDAFVPLAGPANRQGRIAADNLAGIPSRYTGTQGSAVLRCFDLTVATTGINETAAKRAGIPYERSYSFPFSNATYYPGAAQLAVKLLFNKENGKVLGAQFIGQKGADKRCDVMATAIRCGLTVDDLVDLELCYAPPFNSAKDPVNLCGMIAQNILHGRVKVFHWDEIPAPGGDVILLDVRTKGEYERGSIPGFINIPVDELRERLGELDPAKKIYITCQVGLRGYVASRILCQHGFDCYNLSGGYRLYSTVAKK